MAATTGTKIMPDANSQASRLLSWSISRAPGGPAGLYGERRGPRAGGIQGQNTPPHNR